MEKRNKIIYWISTGLLCFSMLGGIGQLLQVKEVVKGFAPLGYPTYFISILGFWKATAIIALLIPKFPLLKEWTYAGIIFAMTGASISHIASNSPTIHIFPPLIVCAIAIFSWYFRPSDRKINTSSISKN